MSREKSMAAIRNALTAPPPPSGETTQVFDIPTLPTVAPPPPKETQEESKKQAKKLEKEQEQTRLQAAKIIRENEEYREEQSNRVMQLVENLSASVGKLWKNTQVQFENLPTPGSLAFPLIILLVFFFLLIPVNGHTRFVWLWLAMTGQAEISGSSPSGFAGNPNVNGASGDFLAPVQQNGTQPVTPLILPQLGVFMTGVSEDYLR